MVAPQPKVEKTPPPQPRQDSRLRGNDGTQRPSENPQHSSNRPTTPNT
ncbi:hypothetical protein HMPREF9123_1400 [Neisseria bacilliformis ATCC BAA-1200]|uniref:Uncharacterized protein n=1 Tax=Neisseria bacilliformis ATCC BAA-1200 TaxID=888742 RepID=F2BC93_9NEIS|nr:hypothetical protein HMPREF9123_1400 [Neisseria bacilliformis ATCC BAA-1200]